MAYAVGNHIAMLVANLPPALACVYVLVAYLRRRDPLDGYVALALLPYAVVFVVHVPWTLSTTVPHGVLSLLAVAATFQPCLMLLLAGQLQYVPRQVMYGAFGMVAVVGVPFLLGPSQKPLWLLAPFLATNVTVALIAAGYFVAGARSRVGPSAVRMWLAALAPLAMTVTAVVIALDFPGSLLSTVVSQLFGVAAGLAFLVAFVPPRWLRRAWLADVWSMINAELLSTPPDATPREVWRRLASAVRAVTGAEGVAVLATRPDGAVHQLAADNTDDPPSGCTAADLEALLAPGRPVRLRTGGRRRPPAVAAHYAPRLPGGYVTPMPLTVPPDDRGVLLVLSRHRTLFAADDLRLLAGLGGQASVLAERGVIIAEQRRLADRLATTVDRLRTASQAKSNFLASMSHELRTPLNSVIGFSELMCTEPERDGRREVPAEWPAHVLSSGRHLLRLINDVLDLTKIEAGRLDLQPTAVRLDQVVAELSGTLRPLIEGKGLTARLHVPPLAALVDPLRLRQMLENLLSNAIKFTPAGGCVTVEGSRTDGTVTVTVADTGVGIAPTDTERVFEEFRQVGDASGRQAGTGLGLALVRRIARAHGGSVSLESTPGRGSRFSLHLPAVMDACDEIPDTGPTAPGRAPGHGRILMIEDDPHTAELMRAYLASTGYEIEHADTGEAGIIAARERTPGAVLLDILLPGINGWEVLQRFKRDPLLEAVPVILVTVVDEPSAGAAMGAAEYLVKPVGSAQLLTTLARHIAPESPPVQPDPTALTGASRRS